MPAYLDWNATAPPLPEVTEAMARVAGVAWANPSSVHRAGRDARKILEDGRAALAQLAGVDPRDVVFTSGGTEANNLALRSGLARASRSGEKDAKDAAPKVLVLSRLEHPSVTRVAEALEAEGVARLRWLRVTPSGHVDLDDGAQALREGNVALVALQAVNHEVGTIQPVGAMAALCAAAGARLHVDAVQAWGRVPFSAADAPGATLSLAAHKLRGPKGVGALVAVPGLPLRPVLLGGSQERGLRPGTLDAVLAAGFAVAARHAAGGAARYEALQGLRDAFEDGVRSLAAARGLTAGFHGGAPRAHHVASFRIAGWPGPELAAAMDLEGVAVSSGSACSAGTAEASPVITAMVGEGPARESVRVSFGETSTRVDVEAALRALSVVLAR